MKFDKEHLELYKDFFVNGISFDIDKTKPPSLMDGIVYYLTPSGYKSVEKITEYISKEIAITEEEAQQLIIKNVVNSRTCSRPVSDAVKLLEVELSESIVGNTVILPVIGILIDAPFKIGTFTIFRKQNYEALNNIQNPFQKEQIEKSFGDYIAVGILKGHSSSSIMIGKKVLENELARFKAFLPLISNGNLRYWVASMSTNVVLADAAITMSAKEQHLNFRILTHPFGLELDKKHSPEVKSFREYLSSIGYDELVTYSGANSKYEKSINMAFWWLGKQADENSNEIKLLYSVFALEKLLSNSTSFSSITAAVAEKCAFLLGSNYDERIKIFKEAKRLYRVRSGLAHGSASEEVTESDVKIAHMLGLQVLLKILEINKTNKLYSIEDLDAYVNKIKFG